MFCLIKFSSKFLQPKSDETSNITIFLFNLKIVRSYNLLINPTYLIFSNFIFFLIDLK